MAVQMWIGLVLLGIVCLAIIVEINRERAAKARRRRLTVAPPQRRPHLERHMVDAFNGPRKSFGECFAQFAIWRQFDITRMELSTNSAWQKLNRFSRSLVLRHLWRALSRATHGLVVVSVDAGAPDAILWTEEVNAAFDDHGVQEPWAPAKGRAGTLISGKYSPPS